MVEKYLNETRGHCEGGDASPAALPMVSPAAFLGLGVESFIAGTAQNAGDDRVDEKIFNIRCGDEMLWVVVVNT